MKYIALLRGINVGGKHKVEMSKLKSLLTSLGFTEVSTYINSGNVVFVSDENIETISKKINSNFAKEFDFEIPTLVLTQKHIQTLLKKIPASYKNDKEYKTDIAFLFPEIDKEKILEKLPIKKEFLEIHYEPGAIWWHLDRKIQNKSQLSKLASNKLYKYMTIRNINTIRYLANF